MGAPNNYYYYFILFFFFKQKTAYEIIAGDWSSDVCSSDLLALLRSSISIPKLLYLLRTSNCFNHPQLLKFDAALKDGLTTILNVDLDETQWIQATLPVRNGGLGMRCANTLATSAF